MVRIDRAQGHQLFQGSDRVALGPQCQGHAHQHVRMIRPQDQDVLEQGQGVVRTAADPQRLGQGQQLVQAQGIRVLRRVGGEGGGRGHRSAQGRSRNWPYMSITWARLGPR